MKSSVVSKIRVYNPNKKGSAYSNREYCKYIATRPGVELLNDTKYNELPSDDMSDNSTYLSYINYRPRSHGLFGNIDTSDLSNVLSDMFDRSEQLIYRGILSLSQEDATNLGYYNVTKWKTLLNSTMSDIANEFNIPASRLQWVAAFHKEESHPHVHYMFWDTEKHVNNPFIHVSKQHNCRERFSAEIFKEEHQQNYIDKTVKRDLIIEYGKDITHTTEHIFKNFCLDEEIPLKIPNRTQESELITLTKQIHLLSTMLPDHGSIKYNYMPKEVKEKVHEITTMLLNRKDIYTEYLSYIDLSVKAGNNYSPSEEKKKIIEQSCIKDIDKRICNIILKTAKKFRSYNISDEKINKIEQKEVVNNENTDEKESNEHFFIKEEKQLNKICNEETYMKLLHKSASDGSSFAHNILDNPDLIDDSYYNSLELSHSNKSLNKDTYIEFLHSASQNGNTFASKILNNPNLLNQDKYLVVEEDKYFNKICNEELYKKLLHTSASNGSSFASKILDNIDNIDLMQDSYYKSLELTHSNDLLNKDFIELSIPNEDFFYKNKKEKLWTDTYKTARSYLYGNSEHEHDFEKAFQLLSEEELSKNPLALFDLGNIYERGLDKDIDLTIANSYYNSALTLFENNFNSDSYVQYRIGKMYSQGKGTDINFSKAVEWYEKAVNQGDKFAQYSLAALYYYGTGVEQDYNKAFDLYLKAAEQGNAFASYNIAAMYESGIGIEQNIENSNVYYQSAFMHFCKILEEKKDDNIFYRVGKMLYIGQGVEASTNDAIVNLEQAANMKNVNALYLLAKIYLKEDNSDKKTIALNYLEEAANMGNGMAQYSLGKLYLDQESDLYNLDLALSFLNLAAEQGNQFAQYSLGKLYLDQESDLYNPDLALSFLNSAAEQGNQFAQYSLGKLYLNQENYLYNPNKALFHFSNAAKQGNLFAENSIGKLYLKQESPLFNPQKGISILETYSKAGNPYTQYELGKSYLYGQIGIQKNNKLGIYWLKKSSEQGNEYAKELLKSYQPNNGILEAAKLISTVLNHLHKENYNQLQNSNNYKSLSKQAKREMARKQGINIEENR